MLPSWGLWAFVTAATFLLPIMPWRVWDRSPLPSLNSLCVACHSQSDVDSASLTVLSCLLYSISHCPGSGSQNLSLSPGVVFSMVFLLKPSTQFAVWDLPHERSSNTVLKTFPSLPIASRMKSNLPCRVLEVLCHLLSYLLPGLPKKHNCHHSHTAILMPSPLSWLFP